MTHHQNLPRLSTTEIHKSHPLYLHYASLHRDIKNAINQYASGKVLDIGCGNKPYEKEFLNRTTGYIGCDIVQSSLQKVDIICDAKAIPFPSEEFDTIFCTQAIEHIAEHQLVLNEAYRLLKNSGRIILSVPFYWPLHETPNDYFRFTKYGLIHLLQQTGFTIENIIENGGSWAVSGQSIIHSLMDDSSKHFILRTMRFIFFRLQLIRLHNSFFSWLDKVDFNRNMPMNYIVIGSK
jgi:ubiquinone/menaquinone biosynthesis C-methylase UbiE